MDFFKHFPIRELHANQENLGLGIERVWIWNQM